jgi:hypothetical protein
MYWNLIWGYCLRLGTTALGSVSVEFKCIWQLKIHMLKCMLSTWVASQIIWDGNKIRLISFLFTHTFIVKKYEHLKRTYLCVHCMLLCSSKEIPEELKQCCNYKNEFSYPSKEIIMQYAVVVTTLVSAARSALLLFLLSVYLIFYCNITFSFILRKPFFLHFWKSDC